MTDRIFLRGISKELWKKVKIEAIAHDRTLAQAVEEALNLWLENCRNEPGEISWDQLVGLGGSGRDDIADRHDEYLAKARLSRRASK